MIANRNRAGSYDQSARGDLVKPAIRLFIGKLFAQHAGLEDFSSKLNAAAALYDFGNLAGRNDALVASIDIYRRTPADATRKRVPLNFGDNPEHNLGTALSTLSGRQSGTTCLEEAWPSRLCFRR